MAPSGHQSPHGPAHELGPGIAVRDRHPAPPLRTIEETAVLHNISKRTIRRLVDQGVLVHVRFGRAKRIELEVVNAFIRLRCRRGQPLTT